MARSFYAVEFRSGPTTTTGEPNRRTGRCSTAVFAEAFTTAAERDDWVNDGRVTSGMQGNCREAVTRATLRHHKRGLSDREFAEDLEHLQWRALNRGE